MSSTYVTADGILTVVETSPQVFRPEEYGAVGDGTTDDTGAIQDAIDACDEGGTVLLGPKAYLLTDTPSIDKNITLRGMGVYNVNRSVNSGINFDSPAVTPFLRGSVLLQSGAAKNGLDIPAAAKSVHLLDFGIRFADAIRHVNTGHGVYARPTATYLSGHDHGLMQSIWKNVHVFGVDGNHYGFNCLNQVHNQWDFLRSYGGGGFLVECDSYAGNYGNLVASHLFAALYQDGSAYGMRFIGRASGAAGYLNLITLIRPQVNRLDKTALYAETTAPAMSGADTQLSFDAATQVGNLTVINPDFEPQTVSPVAFNTGARFITPEGYYGNLSGTDFTLAVANKGARILASDLQFSQKVANATLAAGAQAGGSPPAPAAVNDCGDYRGTLTFGTGSAPSAGALARVTYSQTRGTNLTVVLTAMNAATAALGLYVVQTSTYFEICSVNAPDASQANTVYAVGYLMTRAS